MLVLMTTVAAAQPPRRLNRAEYNNTIRDLLGVDAQPADDFPQDDSGYGFDNIADVLSLPPVLMEKYLSAADKVTRLALFGPPPLSPTLTRLRSDRRVREAHSVPDDYDTTGLSLPNAFHALHRVPVDGEYIVRVFFGGLRPLGSDPITAALWIDGREVQSIVFDVQRSATFATNHQDFGSQTRDFRVRLRAGERWIAVAIPRLYEGLPAIYAGPVPLNGVRVTALEIGGPYAQTTGPSRESLEKIYTCGHLDGRHHQWCAIRVIADFARRAYRRPIRQDELDRIVGLVRRVQREEHSFDEALAVGMQAILVSPDFLFRIERQHSQHELAARLSYFLWASTPDDALRRAADAGRLHGAGLEAEVRRLLRDPKSRALAEQFGSQWLEFRALESITRDRDRFPDFDDYLRLSMRRETELFIEHMIREDRSILDLLDGRYSFLNERLARHYGIPGVRGPEFRRVDLTGTPRAGVLTHASVLTVSSYATRTSPVLRGKWILENFLNAPPPPPPPDVPNLDERAIGSSASLREQLEAHRTIPGCASCHRRMDPLGFGLENFDAVGAFRTRDGKFPIDSSGVLPDGRAFEGADGLRGVLRADRDGFARAVTSKLLTYALGRGLERADAQTVTRIVGRLAEDDYRFSRLVIEIVDSAAFARTRPKLRPTT